MAQSSDSTAGIQVSMPEVVKFIRQLAHDLRNHLNAAELQSAYLVEIAENNEQREEIKRLRAMIAQVGTSLQELTGALSQPRLTQMPYAAKDFVEDLRAKLAADHPAESAQIKWGENVGDATVDIDPQLLLPALSELFANAFRHERTEGPVSAAARVENGHFVFRLTEPKQNFAWSTENWGREPLRNLGQGHYGLGLYRTRGIIEAHGGEFTAHHDEKSGSLVTTVTLPLAAPEA
ncbi:MAG TPA: ATP-binding protein [Chthoniobacterales bacterium]|jgi:K+-sensing histidine kinase KdpD|nr:ATP-binding protein [Chthoniobacterales bacterium]